MTINHYVAELYESLISEDPIVIENPLSWSNNDIVRQLTLIKNCLTKDDLQQSLLLEARRVFYQKNTFIVSLEWLPLFLEDILGDWEDVPVEVLVQDLTIQEDRDTIYHGPALGIMQHQSSPCSQSRSSETPSWLYLGAAATTDGQTQGSSDVSSPSTTNSPTHGSIASEDTWDTVTLVSEAGGDMSWDLSEDIEG